MGQNEAADLRSSARPPPPEPLPLLFQEPVDQESPQLPEEPATDLGAVAPLGMPAEDFVALEESYPSHHNGASGVAPPHHHNMASGADGAAETFETLAAVGQGQAVETFAAVGIGDDVTEAIGQELPIMPEPNSMLIANTAGQADNAASNV